MAGETTGLTIFSYRSVYEEIHGFGGGRLWRPGYLAAFVEKHVPLWVVTPISHGARSTPRHQIVHCNPSLAAPLEINLFPMMASIFSQPDVALKMMAESEGLVHRSGRRWWINDRKIVGPRDDSDPETDEWENESSNDFVAFPSASLLELSSKLISEKCRVTSIRYPHSFLLENDGVPWMRGIGIDVDEFSYTPGGSGF